MLAGTGLLEKLNKYKSPTKDSLFALGVLCLKHLSISLYSITLQKRKSQNFHKRFESLEIFKQTKEFLSVLNKL